MALRIIFAALFALSAFAQSVTPSSLTFRQRGPASPGSKVASGYVAPLPQTVALTATGSWTVGAQTGTLATACDGAGICYTVSPSSGTGNATLTVSFANTNGASILTPGVRTGAFTVAGQTVNVSLTVEAPTALPAFGAGAGYPIGCSTPANFSYPANCTTQNERPNSTAFALVSAGQTFTDPQFGTTIRRITDGGVGGLLYSASTPFSRDNSLVYVYANGAPRIYNRVAGTLAYSPSEFVANDGLMDPRDSSVVWYFSGGTLSSKNLVSGIVTPRADYSAASGTRRACLVISNGSTNDITDDGWLVVECRLANTALNQICLIDGNGLSPANQESKTFCADMALSGRTGGVDFTSVTLPEPNGDRLALAIANGAGVYRLRAGATSLEFWYNIDDADSKFSGNHSDVTSDKSGRSRLSWQYSEVFASGQYYASVILGKGYPDYRNAIETGGGQQIFYYLDSPTSTPYHVGCNDSGQCVYSMYGVTGATLPQVTSVASVVDGGALCTLTTTGAHNIVNGTQIQVAYSNLTAINGVWTATVLTSTTLTIPVGCPGSYTASRANIAAWSAIAAGKNPTQGIIVTSQSNDGTFYSRWLAMNRSVYWPNGTATYDNYYSTARASISRDGCFVGFTSNMGLPQFPDAYVIELNPCAGVTMTSQVQPADVAAVLNYSFPVGGQGAATITISATRDLASPIVNVSDGGTAQARQYVATGLTADTTYFYRIVGQQYSAGGQFRTTPTLSGTTGVSLVKGGGGTINYGATSGLGSSCTSPCSVTVNRGILWTNAAGLAAQVVR